MDNHTQIAILVAVSFPFAWYLLTSMGLNREFRNKISQGKTTNNENYKPQTHVIDRFNNIENMEKEKQQEEADKYNDSINEIGG